MSLYLLLSSKDRTPPGGARHGAPRRTMPGSVRGSAPVQLTLTELPLSNVIGARVCTGVRALIGLEAPVHPMEAGCVRDTGTMTFESGDSAQASNWTGAEPRTDPGMCAPEGARAVLRTPLAPLSAFDDRGKIEARLYLLRWTCSSVAGRARNGGAP